MTIKKAIEAYLNNRAKRLSYKSISTYRSVLNQFASWFGPEKAIQKVTDSDIDTYQLILKEDLSTNTQLFRANILRPFFKFWAIRNESKVLYDAIEGPRREEYHPNFITQEKFDLIDEYFSDEEYYQLTKKLIFNLLWDTGMRIGELLSLNIADLESTKAFAIIKTEKSRKLRMVAWSDFTHRLLIRYLGTRLVLNDAPELFQTPTHKKSQLCRLTTRSVQRWCTALGNELGFAINPHAFRHGKMHVVINAGGSRQQVQTIAGHSSIQSSEVYVRLNEQEQLKMQNQFLTRRPTANHRVPAKFPQELLAWGKGSGL